MAADKLPESVSKKYSYNNAVGIITTPWNERVDLRTITVKEADELFKKGLDDLELIKNNTEKK